MNTFNRIFTIVTIFILTIVGLAVIVLPANLQAASDGVLGVINSIQASLRVAGALLFIVVMFFLLWLEFRRAGSKTVEVARSTGSRIRITTSHVEERLGQQIDALGGVISSRVKVGERDNQVVTQVEVVSAPGLDIVAKGEEIAAIVRVTVSDQLGLKLYGKPQITIKTGKAKTVAIMGQVASASDGSNSSTDAKA